MGVLRRLTAVSAFYWALVAWICVGVAFAAAFYDRTAWLVVFLLAGTVGALLGLVISASRLR